MTKGEWQKQHDLKTIKKLGRIIQGLTHQNSELSRLLDLAEKALIEDREQEGITWNDELIAEIKKARETK